MVKGSGFSTVPYIELHAHSYFSLLDGVPTPEALVEQAAKWDMPALALSDHNGLYGIPRFWHAAQQAGIKAIIGCELTLENRGGHLTLLAENQQGYSNICRLITHAHREGKKGYAVLPESTLAENAAGLIALSGCRRGAIARALLARDHKRAANTAARYADIFDRESFFMEMQRHYERNERYLNAGLERLGHDLGLPMIATGNVHYLTPADACLHDVLTCIRQRMPLERAAGRLRANQEYFFRSPQEMANLFSAWPQALRNTLAVAERCRACPPTGPQPLPQMQLPTRISADAHLRTLCHTALGNKSGTGAGQYQSTLERELKLISEQNLSNYFLLVWDVMCFARQNGILCQGRGSAANSLVAYLLGITSIDPLATSLVFERFLSTERPTPPDIDIDFAADQREKVIQYIYHKYGADHVAMACTVVTFRARSALRDVGFALGFDEGLLQRASAGLDDYSAVALPQSESLRATLGEDFNSPRWQQLLRLAARLDGFPRHLGIHNGGMVLSTHSLATQIPVEPTTMKARTVVQWDKDSLEIMGWIKLDVLSLRMLAAIVDACSLIDTPPDMDTLTFDDPAVFDMLCRAETIGVFQVESRAQAALIPRFQPRSFADLTVQVALIRPGPLQANMVHPYLKRREKREPVTYLHMLLEPALRETMGVIIFQEQVLKVARDLAGFTPGDGEMLRRALGHKHAREQMQAFHTRFLAGARSRGVSAVTAERAFEHLKAFGGYAFSKAHAASFAVITYWSAWLRCYHPAPFFAGLLRQQPMGFYPAHVVLSDARRAGVRFLPVDLRHSQADITLQSGAVRLGLRSIRKLNVDQIELLLQESRREPFHSLTELLRRTELPRPTVESLLLAGALDYLHPAGDRRQMLWDLAESYRAATEAMALPARTEQVKLPPMTAAQRLATEFAVTGVSSRIHPTDLHRKFFSRAGVTPVAQLSNLQDGENVTVGGMVVARQRPPTARGICFLALEDSSGILNVVVYPDVYTQHRAGCQATLALIRGRLQIAHGAVHVVAREVAAV